LKGNLNTIRLFSGMDIVNYGLDLVAYLECNIESNFLR